MKSLLIGESANRKDREAIKAAIEIEPEVVELIHLRTEHLGPEELLVGAKVEFFHELSVVEVADVVDRVERNIRDHVASARVIYLEPDVHRRHRMGNPLRGRARGPAHPRRPALGRDHRRHRGRRSRRRPRPR